MTNPQRQRLKAALIEGELFKLLGRARGKVRLWVKDTGSSLLFSTNNLPDGPELIVKNFTVPSDTVNGTKFLEPSRDQVLAFLKQLINAESAEANRIIGFSESHPRLRVKAIKIDGILTVTSPNLDMVGTEGVLINGCSIHRPMQVAVQLGRGAVLEIELASASDYALFEVGKLYTLIYVPPSGIAIGMAPVPPVGA